MELIGIAEGANAALQKRREDDDDAIEVAARA